MKTKLRKLKGTDFSKHHVALAIVKEYKRDRESHYDVKYVQTDEKLEKRLKAILLQVIEAANTIDEYTVDCPEPEDDLVRVIDPAETDYTKLAERLNETAPEENIVTSVDELVSAKAYLIVLRSTKGIELVGFTRLPENWKMKKTRGLIPLLFKENRFEDLDDGNRVFSISSSVDFLCFDDLLFILSKKGFERGLNFKEGMLRKADVFYSEVKQSKVFKNFELLESRVSNNQRYLRKIATILNLGHYKNPVIMAKIMTKRKRWGLIFEGNQLVITDDTIDDILTVLQNKRLHSELTEEDFDVESAKKFGPKP